MTLTQTDQPASAPPAAEPRRRGVPLALVFLGRRLAALVVVVWIVEVATFLMVRLIPGAPGLGRGGRRAPPPARAGPAVPHPVPALHRARAGPGLRHVVLHPAAGLPAARLPARAGDRAHRHRDRAGAALRHRGRAAAGHPDPGVP